MKNTSPPHEQKLEFHRLRAAGQFPGGPEGWKLYLAWREKKPPPGPPEEPPPTPQEELGF